MLKNIFFKQTSNSKNDLLHKIEEAKEIYERDGITIIPNVFQEEEIQKIRAAAFMSLTKIDQIKKAGYKHNVLETRTVKNQEFPALLFFPTLVSDYLNQIRTDERLITIVQSFLGKEVKQLNNQIYFRLPGDGDSFAWHQDIHFRKPTEDYPEIEGSYLQTLIVVDEITEYNGAVEFIPGTHTEGDLQLIKGLLPDSILRKFKRNEKTGIKYLGKPGDVMIWSVMTIHGSEANQSPSSRMTYMNGFAKANAAKHWPFYLKNGNVIKKIDPTLFP